MTQDQNKDFYKKALRIGLPIALSQLVTSLLSVIDTFMVSSLGDNPLAAVAIGANFGFFLIMVMFGFLSGLGIFIAQFWGSKDINSIHKVFIISVIIGVIFSTVFFFIVHFNPQFIVGLYNNGDSIVDKAEITLYGVQYLSIISFSYFTMTASFVVMMLMRSVEKVIFPTLVSIFTVLLNTFLNYGLINGNMGFPNLGVEGAAIATVISGGTGSLILISFFFITKEEVFKIKFNRIKDISREFLGKLAKKALPVAINETIWGLGMSAYLMAIGFISVEAIASVQISNQIMGMFWVANAGISTACAIMIGNKLGENNLELAKEWGKKFVKLSFVAGIIFGVILFVSSGFISEQFTNVSETVRSNLKIILMIFSFYVPIKFSNALQIIGTLRAGGDTKYALLAEIIPLWGFGVPIAFILSIYSTLPVYIIVGIMNIEELIKFLLVIKRFLSYKWVKNLTVQAE